MVSRLFWFFVGGATATWLMKDRSSRCGFSRRSVTNSSPEENPTSSSPEAQHNHIAPPHSQLWRQQMPPYQWEEEKARIRELSRNAADSMAELSEVTLDALQSTVGALKAKLAEHRQQREQERRP